MPDSMSNTEWYRQSFGELYPLIYSHRSLEAAQNEIARLASWAPLRPGDTVLDACCGNGRHLSAICQSGCDGIGFDLSEELTVQASKQPGLRHRVFRGDLLQIPLDRTFDRVVNLFTSFGYFQDFETNRDAFNSMANRVGEHGVFILDHMNAHRIRETLVPRSEEVKKGWRIIQSRSIEGSRVRKRIEVSKFDHESVSLFFEDVRLFEPVEMIELARQAGFADITLHGSFSGEPFSLVSPRMILRAHRE